MSKTEQSPAMYQRSDGLETTYVEIIVRLICNVYPVLSAEICNGWIQITGVGSPAKYTLKCIF